MALAAPLDAWAAEGVPLTFGPLTVRGMAIELREVHANTEGVTIVGFSATAVGSVSAGGGVPPPPPPFPLDLSAGQVSLTDSYLGLTSLSYTYGSSVGTSPGVSFNTSIVPSPLDAEIIDLAIPIQVPSSPCLPATPKMVGSAHPATLPCRPCPAYLNRPCLTSARPPVPS